MDVSRLCPHCMREQKSTGDFCPYCGKNIKKIEAGLHQLNPFTILQGKYLVGDVLGEGGFGITYIGIDMNLEVRVAIKEFYPNGYVSRDHTQTTIVTQFNNSNAEAVRKWKEGFVKEARALGKCQNLPGIVGVKDFFEENGTAYIVMEYIDGTTLKSYVKKKGGKLSPEELLPVIRPVMTSLQQVHDTGVIHRDISPDNIMFTNDGTMKLLDFGAARSYAEADAQKSLSVMLKPGYAPEEQYRTHGNQGPWSDVYALAATIYRCITGVVPVESMERMRNDTLKSPKELGINISDQMDQAIMKAMAVYAENRFQSVKEFEAALYDGARIQPVTPVGNVQKQAAPNPVAGGQVAAQAAPAPQKKDNSKLPLIIGIAAVAALLVGFLVYSAAMPKNARSSGDTAPYTEDKVSPAVEAKEENNDTAPAEEAEGAESAESTQSTVELPWQNAYLSLLSKQYGNDIFTLQDINKDGIPEIIVIKNDGVAIITSDSEGNLDTVETPTHAVAIDSSKGRVCTSFNKDLGIQDHAYGITYGKWTDDQHGEAYIYFNEYDECFISCEYYLDDKFVQKDAYYSWLSGIYNNATSLEDMKFADCSRGAEVLKAFAEGSDVDQVLYATYTSDVNENFDCDRTVKVIFATSEGDYYFELKGGAGGADGNRALEGQGYDGNGALLSGKIHMKVGDRAYVVVGGAGGITQASRGVVSGGFNGGGDAFWSGGGGGCTDVYYNDERVASAAGGGGGNYEENGKPGRASYEGYSNTLDLKLGGGTGYTKNDDAGGGGGAGWPGGSAGKKDHAGFGGVNGWDSSYFRDVNESTGADRTQSGTQDGYAHVYRK